MLLVASLISKFGTLAASVLGAGSGVDNLLLETADNFLLESGTTDVLVLE